MKATAFLVAVGMAAAQLVTAGGQDEIAKFDPNMAVANGVVTNGARWIDGRDLPLEGRVFTDVARFYDRLPSNVTAKVNGGVRSLKSHSAGMQFRFATDSKRLTMKWVPLNGNFSMDHMPSTGVSGIDIYRYDSASGKWRYVKTGRITNAKGGEVTIGWTPGTPCLVNLPLYNGIRSFKLGIDENATVTPLPPRASGVNKPVVFYGTSITHGGCCSRPGLSFVNIVGRDLDVPVVNLGFSGSGQMELEMSEHLARIDASCYVLDCIWNMNDKMVKSRYEPFLRNLRRHRPETPIVMAEWCDVFGKGKDARDASMKALYEKLVAEGWKNLIYLPKDNMFSADGEGTVDGCHPNDLGMRTLADAFGGAVREALHLK